MDAGTAAVLGALAGSTATIGAALATGWAQREGARIAARSEHRRERREPRQNTYKRFIAAASDMRSAVGIYGLDVDLGSDAIDEHLSEEWSTLAHKVGSESLDVALAGPEQVTTAAIKIASLSSEIRGSVNLIVHLASEGTPERIRLSKHMRKKLKSEVNKFEEAVEGFVLRAQAALDDDGSR